MGVLYLGITRPYGEWLMGFVHWVEGRAGAESIRLYNPGQGGKAIAENPTAVLS
ncbi:hypothetical protein PJF56_22080 [Roseofilum sp. BLCC_M91]|uniref:Uncharacterized protein n=1 Tax=Roseofilum halophilum BLCC-M91 TaxID=3022259 RepID=A0ABT7BQT5_9CYAN|nr:hypothetical protein [Roseofilum halophilum]MDJ1181559.1 hypothetical protein [Roseofilum halophilum BLCC-M91]